MHLLNWLPLSLVIFPFVDKHICSALTPTNGPWNFWRGNKIQATHFWPKISPFYQHLFFVLWLKHRKDLFIPAVPLLRELRFNKNRLLEPDTKIADTARLPFWSKFNRETENFSLKPINIEERSLSTMKLN